MTVSNPAKILAAYMRCSGVTDAKQLSAALDIPLRTIQRLKLEASSLFDNATSVTSAISGVPQTPTTPDVAASVPPNAPDMALADASSACAGNTTRATKESFQDSTYLEVSKIPPTPQGEPGRVRFADGRLILGGELRAFWMTEFGDDAKRLDLALIEVGGRIQANSTRSIEVQVSSQLARIAADKRDRDTRYRSAVAANANSAPRTDKPAMESTSAMIARMRAEGAFA